MKQRTQGQKKIIRKLNDLSVTDAFLDAIKLARAELNIQDGGYPFVKEDSARLFPGMYCPSVYWQDKHPDIQTDQPIRKLINKLSAEIGLENSFISLAITCYLFHDDFLFDELLQNSGYLNRFGLCELREVSDQFEYLLNQSDHFSEFIEKHFDEDGFVLCDSNGFETDYLKMLLAMLVNQFLIRSESYPVSLNISAHASKRDVKDFIDANWSTIEEFQAGYRESEKKDFSRLKRNPKVKKRNDLIYENHSLSWNEINNILRENGLETLDYNYINKIISDEKIKREKK